MEKALNKKAPTTALRFERKFIYEDILLEDLIETEVFLNPFGFKEIFYRRTVNNIYFDDFDMSFYRQNVSGDAKREKYRLRWYGDSFFDIVDPTFEIKKKFGEAGDKYSFKMKGTSFSFTSNTPQEIKAKVAQRITELGNIVLATKVNFIEPSLFNTYERRYFLSACGNYRITLDYNQCFFNPSVADIASSKFCIDDIVLELKYALPFDDESRTLTQSLKARLSKNSKYVTGIETFST